MSHRLPNGRFVPLKQIRRFVGPDYARALAQLEQNILEKFENDNFRAFGPFKPTPVRSASTAARPWDLVRLDPSAAGFRVLLPSPKEPDAGFIILKNVTDSTNAVEVRPIGGTIDGAASKTMNVAREAMWLAPDPNRNDWLPLCCGPETVDPADILPGDDGDYLQTIGGNVVWAPLGASGGGAWVDRWTPDLLGEPSYTFPGDVTQAIAGVTIEADNTANGTLGVNISAGTGLNFQHGNAATVLGGTGRSGPLMMIPIQEFGPLGWIVDGPLRVQLHFDTTGSLDTNFQFFFAGFEMVANHAHQVLGAVGWNTQAITGGQMSLGVSPAYFIADQAIGSNDVMELRFDPATMRLSVGFGEWAGDWPDIEFPQGSMGKYGAGTLEPGGWVINKDDSTTSGESWQLMMGVMTGNTAGAAFTINVLRARVQQWVPG